MNRILFYTLTLIFSFIVFHETSFAQLPEKMSYQAVIRDLDDQLVRNQTVRIKISILQDSVSGNPVYIEEHTPISNNNGLVTLEVGNGQVLLGDFSGIDWAEGLYFIKSETDPDGNFDYTISGISQLLAVPFAFHAKTAENVPGINSIVSSVLNSYSLIQISDSDTANWNNKLDSLIGNEAVFDGWDKDNSDDFSGKYNDLSGKPTQVSHFNNDAGYLTQENDPEFNASVAAGITSSDTAAWNAASTGSFSETDPIFTAWDKSTGISITQSQVSDLTFEIFEKELTENENNIDVGFDLQSASIVFINGMALPSDKWSGLGTQILILDIPIKKYDNLKIKK